MGFDCRKKREGVSVFWCRKCTYWHKMNTPDKSNQCTHIFEAFACADLCGFGGDWLDYAFYSAEEGAKRRLLLLLFSISFFGWVCVSHCMRKSLIFGKFNGLITFDMCALKWKKHVTWGGKKQRIEMNLFFVLCVCFIDFKKTNFLMLLLLLFHFYRSDYGCCVHFIYFLIRLYFQCTIAHTKLSTWIWFFECMELNFMGWCYCF